jgi:hypothetical protein
MIRKASDTITNLAAALVKAAGELEDIKRGGSASIPTKSGGSYSYSYATLPDILQAVRPILAKHGLAAIQNASTGLDGHLDISTMLVHSSGEYLVLDGLPMPLGSTAQETGSAITYGRRYHLLAALGLAPDDDDDGASAAPRQNAGPRQGGSPRPATDAQKRTLREMAADRDYQLPDLDALTIQQASALFEEVKAAPKRKKGDKLSKVEDEELRTAAAYDGEEPF